MLSALVTLVVLLSGIASTAQAPNGNILVADAYYWSGPEGNLGIEITGKFQSEEGLKNILSLSSEIGLFKDRRYPSKERNWTLRDVLISVDLNANGSVATWRVSGPRPLLASYLDRLKRLYEDKSMFYDFGYSFVDFKPSND